MTPTPAEIRAARAAAQLTQAAAAALVYRQRRAWAGWEAGEWPMPAALWALFQLRAAPAPTTDGATG